MSLGACQKMDKHMEPTSPVVWLCAGVVAGLVCAVLICFTVRLLTKDYELRKLFALIGSVLVLLAIAFALYPHSSDDIPSAAKLGDWANSVRGWLNPLIAFAACASVMAILLSYCVRRKRKPALGSSSDN